MIEISNKFNVENKMLIDYFKLYKHIFLSNIINLQYHLIAVFNINNANNNVVTELAELMVWFTVYKNILCDFHRLNLILISGKCINTKLIYLNYTLNY